MWSLFVVSSILLQLSCADPIFGGQNVGTLSGQNNRIVVNNPGKYPYLILLDFTVLEIVNNNEILQTKTFCGGTLILSNLVLSAAHCINDFITEPMIKATAGIVHRQLEQGEKNIGIDFLMHPDYTHNEDSRTYQQNDIALFWMLNSFTLGPKVRLAKLVQPNVDLRRKVVAIAGWGKTDRLRKVDMLMDGEIKVIPNQECARKHDDTDIVPSVFCALDPAEKVSVCSGDSGGPAIWNGVVVGITSWGGLRHITTPTGYTVSTCNPKAPSVFTRVENYLGWITTNILLGSPKSQDSRKRKPTEEADSTSGQGPSGVKNPRHTENPANAKPTKSGQSKKQHKNKGSM